MQNQRSIANNRVNSMKRTLFSGLALMLSFVALPLLINPTSMSAQDQPIVTITATLIPPPTEPTNTPTSTPLPDPILSQMMRDKSQITISNVSEMQQFYSWQAQIDAVTSLVFTPVNNGLVSTSYNSGHQVPSIRLWNIEDGSVNLVGHTFEDVPNAAANIPHAQLSPDGQILVAAYGPTVTLWDAATTRRIASIPLFSPVTATLYDGNKVAVGGSNGVVSLWVVRLPYEYQDTATLPQDYVFYETSSQLMTAFQVGEEVIQVAHDRDMTFILTRRGRLLIHEFNFLGEENLTTVQQEDSDSSKALAGEGIMMALQSDQQYVVYSSSQQNVVVYDYANDHEITRYLVEQKVGCLALSPNRELLIIGDLAGDLSLYNMQTHEFMNKLQVGQPLSACAFNEDGTLIALGNAQGQITLWGIKSR